MKDLKLTTLNFSWCRFKDINIFKNTVIKCVWCLSNQNSAAESGAKISISAFVFASKTSKRQVNETNRQQKRDSSVWDVVAARGKTAT